MIEIVIPGEPKGKARPRFDSRSGRTYTPTSTLRAEQRIQTEWIHAGRPTLPDGPLALHVEIVLARPQGHWKRDGNLSAAGERSAWPTKKPDLDNAVKLAMDACNGGPYRDDALIVSIHLVKRWANPGEQEHTRLRLWPMPELRAPGQPDEERRAA